MEKEIAGVKVSMENFFVIINGKRFSSMAIESIDFQKDSVGFTKDAVMGSLLIKTISGELDRFNVKWDLSDEDKKRCEELGMLIQQGWATARMTYERDNMVYAERAYKEEKQIMRKADRSRELLEYVTDTFIAAKYAESPFDCRDVEVKL